MFTFPFTLFKIFTESIIIGEAGSGTFQSMAVHLGELYVISTTGHLYKWDGNETLIPVIIGSQWITTSKSYNGLISYIGELWAIDDENIWRADGATWDYIGNVSTSPLYAMIVSNGNIYIIDAKGVLFEFDGNQPQQASNPINPTEARTLLIEYNSSIYGMHKGKLWRWNFGLWEPEITIVLTDRYYYNALEYNGYLYAVGGNVNIGGYEFSRWSGGSAWADQTWDGFNDQIFGLSTFTEQTSTNLFCTDDDDINDSLYFYNSMSNFDQLDFRDYIVNDIIDFDSKLIGIEKNGKLLNLTSFVSLYPTVQSYNITFTDVSHIEMTINWINGDGGNRIVAVREIDQGTITNPSDNTTYTASNDWTSKGDQLGSSGYYIVYNGGSNSVTLTQLTIKTIYWVQIFEYKVDSGAEKYLLTAGTNNPAFRGTSISANSGSWSLELNDVYTFNNVISYSPVSYEATDKYIYASAGSSLYQYTTGYWATDISDTEYTIKGPAGLVERDNTVTKELFCVSNGIGGHLRERDSSGGYPPQQWEDRSQGLSYPQGLVQYGLNLYAINQTGIMYEWSSGLNVTNVTSSISGNYISGVVPIVLNNKIYLMFRAVSTSYTTLYEWNGSNAWITMATYNVICDDIYDSVIFNNAIYTIVREGIDFYLYKWESGNSFSSREPLYNLDNDYAISLIVYNNDIYIASNAGHLIKYNYGEYKIVADRYNETNWTITDITLNKNVVSYGWDSSIIAVTSSGELFRYLPPPFEISYGKLYNWYAVTNANVLAPTGWRIPTETDFETLRTYLGGTSVAGGEMKEVGFSYWDSPNTGATNNSGFNGLGGGRRIDGATDFTAIRESFYMWTSTASTSTHSKSSSIHYDSAFFNNIGTTKGDGLSIRMIKDNSIDPETLTDYDGNIYNTVTIGTQVWTAQNWKCTHYKNGVLIPNITVLFNWSEDTTGAWCYYDNNSGYD